MLGLYAAVPRPEDRDGAGGFGRRDLSGGKALPVCRYIGNSPERIERYFRLLQQSRCSAPVVVYGKPDWGQGVSLCWTKWTCWKRPITGSRRCPSITRNLRRRNA